MAAGVSRRRGARATSPERRRDRLGTLAAVAGDEQQPIDSALDWVAEHTRTYVESGVALDAKLSSELLQSIFTETTPLHDGGIVIQGDRIVALGPFGQHAR